MHERSADLLNGEILAGFAGATADAFSLLSRFETKLGEFQGQLERAAIELSKDWRTDKYLRHLEALLIVADKNGAFLISGKGDVISSDEGLLSVGSGSMYALAAARALINTQSFRQRKLLRKHFGSQARSVFIQIQTLSLRSFDRNADFSPQN